MTTDTSLSFSSFGLSAPVLAALERKGFTTPSPIQALALPKLLADSGHLVAKARTGTGKTAAFGIPLVERLNTASNKPKALILTPTRELALQVTQELRSYAGGQYPRIAAVYGGASIGMQLRDLQRGVEIVVGTPGRVMDHLERGSLDLASIDWFVLDEADEMLDMGFFEDVETILAKTKSDRRVALFSATMPAPILRVIREQIGEVEIVEDKASDDEKPAVDQYFLVLRREDRLETLRRLIDAAEDFYGLIFCSTKAETDELSRRLVEAGYPAEAIHGDLSQEARERTLRRFRSRMTTLLVATDVAARGIDVANLTHVINWDLPNDREFYVHRIGRTGRAGKRGLAISFVPPIARERIQNLSRSMEKTLGAPIRPLPIPSVQQVMEAARKRILAKVLAAAPAAAADSDIEASDAAAAVSEAELAATFGADDARAILARELSEALGPQRALEALIGAVYGNELDSSRYKHIEPIRERAGRPQSYGERPVWQKGERGGFNRPQDARRSSGAPQSGSSAPRAGSARVYIAMGRRHGASARDVAGVLMRAGGVPSRLVDSLELRDFCAFATLPVEAARRAFEFARGNTDHPVIRPATPAGERQ